MARELLMVIGGTIKHSVFRKVLSGKVVITNPEEFANYADSILKSISVLCVRNVKSGLEEECRKLAKYISGTLQIHFIHCDYSDMCTSMTFYDTSEDGALIGKVSYKDPENVCCSSESSDNMPSSSSDIGYNIDDFVEVIYEGEKFPGKVVAIPDKVNITVKCLVKLAVPGSV